MARVAELGFAPRPVDLRPLPFERNLGAGNLRRLRPCERSRHANWSERAVPRYFQKKYSRWPRARRERAGPGPADRGTRCRRWQSPFCLGRGRQWLRQHRIQQQCRRRRARRRGAGARSEYGQGAPIAETVMVEHSQPNTHKAFHVGICGTRCSASRSAISCAPPGTMWTPITSATSACTW